MLVFDKQMLASENPMITITREERHAKKEKKKTNTMGGSERFVFSFAMRARRSDLAINMILLQVFYVPFVWLSSPYATMILPPNTIFLEWSFVCWTRA